MRTTATTTAAPTMRQQPCSKRTRARARMQVRRLRSCECLSNQQPKYSGSRDARRLAVKHPGSHHSGHHSRPSSSSSCRASRSRMHTIAHPALAPHCAMPPSAWRSTPSAQSALSPDHPLFISARDIATHQMSVSPAFSRFLASLTAGPNGEQTGRLVGRLSASIRVGCRGLPRALMAKVSGVCVRACACLLACILA